MLDDNSEHDILKLEKELFEMENVLNNKYCAIGKEMLDHFEREFENINRLVDEIIEKRKKISYIKKEVNCPHCMSLNKKDNIYCEYCGEKIIKDLKLK